MGLGFVTRPLDAGVELGREIVDVEERLPQGRVASHVLGKTFTRDTPFISGHVYKVGAPASYKWVTNPISRVISTQLPIYKAIYGGYHSIYNW